MVSKFIWEIDRLDVIPTLSGASNVIVNIRYRCIARDLEDNTGSHTGSFPLTVNSESLKPENFISYTDLTLEKCVGWLHEQMGSLAVSAIQYYCMDAIDLAKNNTGNSATISCLPPWDSKAAITATKIPKIPLKYRALD